jgi:hypothetical protein
VEPTLLDISVTTVAPADSATVVLTARRLAQKPYATLPLSSRELATATESLVLHVVVSSHTPADTVVLQSSIVEYHCMRGSSVISPTADRRIGMGPCAPCEPTMYSHTSTVQAPMVLPLLDGALVKRQPCMGLSRYELTSRWSRPR